MKSYTVYVPVTLNNGDEVSPETLRNIKDWCLFAFGGYTYNPAPMLGAWRDDDGKCYYDTVNTLTVFTAYEPAIVALAKHIAVTLDQVCVAVVSPIGEVSFVYQSTELLAA